MDICISWIQAKDRLVWRRDEIVVTLFWICILGGYDYVYCIERLNGIDSGRRHGVSTGRY